ncbi:MAG TPA: hypothetical protein VGM56_08600 [Byssovorax sp.]|jgi:hypothetical protein
MNRNTLSLALLVGASALLGLGCASSAPCRRGPKDDVAMAGRTTGEAVKTGAETGVEGVKTAGKAVKGFVEGGAPEAKAEWSEGKQDTRAVANEGAAETREDASLPPCD